MGRKIKIAIISLVIVLALSMSFNIYYIVFKMKINNNLSKNNSIDGSREEYVLIMPVKEYSLFLNHDVKALYQFSRDTGVRISVEGPPQYDIRSEAQAIENAIKRKPAGIMVIGAERSLIPYVNKAVMAGIPTITVDADLPESKRLAFVGSNWFNIGVKQGEAMVKLIGGKGKVAMMGISGADNMEQGFAGFKSVLKDYPDIFVLGEYDDMANTKEAQRITEELIRSNPDIAGIAGFDSNSGPGIGEAVKAAKLKGKVKVTAVDIEPEHLALVKQGVIQKLIGQKRELFTFYGARLLYDLNHSNITLTKNDKGNAIIPIPYIIDTGLIEVDEENVFTIDSNK